MAADDWWVEGCGLGVVLGGGWSICDFYQPLGLVRYKWTYFSLQYNYQSGRGVSSQARTSLINADFLQHLKPAMCFTSLGKLLKWSFLAVVKSWVVCPWSHICNKVGVRNWMTAPTLQLHVPHIISNTNYTTRWGMKFPSEKFRYHENVFGELTKCSETPPWVNTQKPEWNGCHFADNFHMLIVERKCLYFNSNFTEICA